jgi:hypothetical protein
VMSLKMSNPAVDIDAEQFGNEMRFVNSSKLVSSAPNIKFCEMLCDDGPHLLVYTLKPIRANEEILADYGSEDGK